MNSLAAHLADAAGFAAMRANRTVRPNVGLNPSVGRVFVVETIVRKDRHACLSLINLALVYSALAEYQKGLTTVSCTTCFLIFSLYFATKPAKIIARNLIDLHRLHSASSSSQG